MTKKLFWDDAYIKEFDAVIQNIDGNKIVLDQTAFNGKGGGLPGDIGWLNDIPVIDSIKQGDEILHIVQDSSRFHVGDKVHGKLDWDKRYKIMRMHTAAHALIGVFSRSDNLLATGNQVGYDESRIDFNMEILDRNKILEYCEEANKILEKDGEVKIYFMKREEALKDPYMLKLASAMPPNVKEWRIVDLGFDRQPDGGVHVKHFKEVGKIKITRFENKGKVNRRIYFVLENR